MHLSWLVVVFDATFVASHNHLTGLSYAWRPGHSFLINGGAFFPSAISTLILARFTLLSCSVSTVPCRGNVDRRMCALFKRNFWVYLYVGLVVQGAEVTLTILRPSNLTIRKREVEGRVLGNLKILLSPRRQLTTFLLFSGHDCALLRSLRRVDRLKLSILNYSFAQRLNWSILIVQNELFDFIVDRALNLLVFWLIFLFSSAFHCLLKLLFERARSYGLRHCECRI